MGLSLWRIWSSEQFGKCACSRGRIALVLVDIYINKGCRLFLISFHFGCISDSFFQMTCCLDPLIIFFLYRESLDHILDIRLLYCSLYNFGVLYIFLQKNCNNTKIKIWFVPIMTNMSFL